MREVVAFAALVDDPQAPQLVDRVHHAVGVEVAGLHQQVEGEVAPDRGGQAGQLTGGRAGLVQAAAQDGLEVTGRQRAVLAAGGAHRLDDVQREAARGRLQQVPVAVQERPPADRLGEQGGVGDLQRGERRAR